MRQFLALRLTPAWHEILEARRRALAPRLPGWRWLRSDSIHLTLRFLGDVSDETDAVARPAWNAAAGAVAPFELRLAGLGAFPARRRPRILWAGLEPCRALTDLAAAIERAARESGFGPEEREFHPHLTLARARRGGRVVAPAEDDREVAAPPCPVREVVLFQSVLDPDGARYTALESYALATRR